MTDYDITEGQIQLKQLPIGTVVKMGSNWYEITGNEIANRKVVPIKNISTGAEDYGTSTGKIDGIRTDMPPEQISNLLIRSGDLEPWQQALVDKYFAQKAAQEQATSDQIKNANKPPSNNDGIYGYTNTKGEYVEFVGSKQGGGFLERKIGDVNKPYVWGYSPYIPASFPSNLSFRVDYTPADLQQFSRNFIQQKVISETEKDPFLVLRGTFSGDLTFPRMVFSGVGNFLQYGFTPDYFKNGMNSQYFKSNQKDVENLIRERATSEYYLGQEFLDRGGTIPQYSNNYLFSGILATKENREAIKPLIANEVIKFETVAAPTIILSALTGGAGGAIGTMIGRGALVGFTGWQLKQTIEKPSSENLGMLALTLPFGLKESLDLSPVKIGRVRAPVLENGEVTMRTFYKGLYIEQGQRTTGVLGLVEGKLKTGIPILEKNYDVIGVGGIKNLAKFQDYLPKSANPAFAKLVESSYMQPERVFETRFFEKNVGKLINKPSKALTSGLTVSPESQQYIFARSIELVRRNRAIESIFRNKSLLYDSTSKIDRMNVERILKFNQKEQGIIFGSFATRYGLNKIYVRQVGDIDLFFKGANEVKLEALTRKLAGNIKGMKVRVPEAEPYHIEAMLKGKWEKIIELKSDLVRDMSAPVKPRALGFKTDIERYTTRYNAKLLNRIGGGKIATVRGESFRKLSAINIFQREGGIGVMHGGRFKDVADFLRIGYTLTESGYKTGKLSTSAYLKNLDILKNIQKKTGIKSIEGETKFDLLIDKTPRKSIIRSASLNIRSPSFSPRSMRLSASLSKSMSKSLSGSPSLSRSLSPSRSPSLSPSRSPSISPSIAKSLSPSLSRSLSPSRSPSLSPSRSPSLSPSPSKSPSPTKSPPSIISSLSRGSGIMRGGKLKTVKLPAQYRASLRALGENIRSPKMPKGIGDFDIRPIISGRTRRRKRRR